LPKDPSPLGSAPHGTHESGVRHGQIHERPEGRWPPCLPRFRAALPGRPARPLLPLTNPARCYPDRAALSFAERLAAYAKSHSEAMANKGYIYHSTGDQLREALEGYTWELGGKHLGGGPP